LNNAKNFVKDLLKGRKREGGVVGTHFTWVFGGGGDERNYKGGLFFRK